MINLLSLVLMKSMPKDLSYLIEVNRKVIKISYENK
jgi:hypothetical protein